eukprot:125016-Rhodomonas_salina.2
MSEFEIRCREELEDKVSNLQPRHGGAVLAEQIPIQSFLGQVEGVACCLDARVVVSEKVVGCRHVT